MAPKMEYEPESSYKANSPLSYDVEEGELSSGSGRSSPGTIRDNAARRPMSMSKRSPPCEWKSITPQMNNTHKQDQIS